MKKFLRIFALVGAVGLVAAFEVLWLGQVDYENQKNRSAELLAEISGEISIMESGLLNGEDIGEAKGRFETAFQSLRAIPYVVNERSAVVDGLKQFEEKLPGQIELAKELRILRLLCEGFVGKIDEEFKDQKINAGFFRTMNKEFLELSENLPDVQYESTVELVAQAKGVINQVGVSAAAVANCVGVCTEATMKVQSTALEKKLDEAILKIQEMNQGIGAELDSSALLDILEE